MPMESEACTSAEAPSMLKRIYKFYSNKRSHPDDVFVFQERPCIVQQANAKLCSVSIITDKNGKGFPSQKSSSWSPQSPDVFGVLLKDEAMLHSCKHGTVLTFLRCVHHSK